VPGITLIKQVPSKPQEAVPGRPPGGSQEDPRGSQEKSKEAPNGSRRLQERPKRPQEAPEGPKMLQELPGKHQAKHNEIWFPHRMAKGGHVCDTYGVKLSFPLVKHDGAHANTHNAMRFGFRIGWLKKAILATTMRGETLISFIET
jgi:hypothetical protein